jgi:putative transcriptional regulator
MGRSEGPGDGAVAGILPAAQGYQREDSMGWAVSSNTSAVGGGSGRLDRAWGLPGVYSVAMRNRLRVLRAERDWTQAELAERLGVSRQTIHAIESEKYDPSLPLAFKMAKLFDQPIETIFSPDESGFASGSMGR